MYTSLSVTIAGLVSDTPGSRPTEANATTYLLVFMVPQDSVAFVLPPSEVTYSADSDSVLSDERSAAS